jgi:L-ribulose-5-phosphate 4-epimerase
VYRADDPTEFYQGHMEIGHATAKQEIVDACRRLDELGFVFGTYGNVSVRVPEGLIITPSRIEYALLTVEDLVTLTLDGKVIDGHRLPSSEFSVHRGIYPRRADVNAIIHTHSFFATTLSCLSRDVPVIVEEQSQVLGGQLRCTSYVPAGQHSHLSEQVAQTLGEANAVLISNHGMVACGSSLSEAMFTCRIVERVSQMQLLAEAAGGAVPIPQEYVGSERYRWLYQYGTESDKVLDQ